MTTSNNAEHQDLTAGVRADSIADGGTLLGRVGEDEVGLVRSGGEFFAIGAHCTHYHGPLDEGLVVNDTVRCPWHHACFSLRTGEALRAPALDPITRWRVDQEGGMLFVREQLGEANASGGANGREAPSSVVIIGGGAAGLAAADMLRRDAYQGPITILSADGDPPVDRPNLSKDFLAGEAQDEWMPLWPPERYEERHVDLLLRSRVSSIDTASRKVRLEDGSEREYGAVLIATGANPVRLPIPGADQPHVLYLRSFADSRTIVNRLGDAKRVVVVGASFIGLEVSASLRARDVAVDVVAPDHEPLGRVMGPEVGRFIREVHESHGVVFHLGETVTSVAGRSVTLSGGSTLEADLVVVGVGVKPSVDMAEASGLTLDRGIAVNEYLETSAPGVFAAGDVARWPDPHTGDRLRVEHWVVAERQGQVAARNILGRRERFDAVPFFWSKHYDVTINYVGHAETWDAVRIDGSLEARDCTVTYVRDGRTLAVATIARDRASLEAEAALEGVTARG